MLYGDHLGSASVAVTSSGTVQRMRYKPWGEVRYGGGTTFPTDRLFTGQLYDGDTAAGGTGLYFYNARYYDPALGRFTQADTIVPDPANPMAFDRYAYVYNSPLKYTDPSGHCVGDPQQGIDEQCWAVWEQVNAYVIGQGYDFLKSWGIYDLRNLLDRLEMGFDFVGHWSSRGMQTVLGALDLIENALGRNQMRTLLLGQNDYLYLQMCQSCRSGTSHIAQIHPTWGPQGIIFNANNVTQLEALHELGHIVDGNLHMITGRGKVFWSETGFIGKGGYDKSGNYIPSSQKSALKNNNPRDAQEDFADTFALWVYVRSDFIIYGGSNYRLHRDRRSILNALFR